MAAHYNPLVFDRKNVFMQRISDAAGHGYSHWTSGKIPLERLPALCRKFSDLYLVGLPKDQRHKRKKLGLGNAVFLLWEESPGNIHWVLLITAGEHPAHMLEELATLSDSASRVNVTGYELTRLPRKDQATPAWTWRMSPATYQEWKRRIDKVTKSRNPKSASDAYYSLYRSPGFAGIRSQVGHLVKYFKTVWKRVKHGGEPFPAPRNLYYVSRLKDRGTTLSKLVKLRTVTQAMSTGPKSVFSTTPGAV